MRWIPLNLIDIIESYGIGLEKRGSEYWCSCPWHEDTNPSFSVSNLDGRWVFYCFSCGCGGGPVNFIAQEENIPYWAAKKKYYELTGRKYEEREDKSLFTEIVDYLRTSDIPYLKERGISENAIIHYRVGYCDSYADLLKHFNLSWDDAHELGLWDISGCVIYPYYDFEGAFKIHARKTSQKEYKKLKSDLYRESLWGIDLVQGDKVFVCEGFHDAMMLWERGYQAVAMAGTVFHGVFWQELRTMGIKEIVLIPDGDMAGTKFLYKMVNEFDSDFIIRVIELRDCDPDEYLSTNVHLPTSVPLLQWYIDKLETDDNIELMRKIKDPLLRMKDADRAALRPMLKKRIGDDVLDILYCEVEPDYAAEEIVLANCLYSDNIKNETYAVLSDEDFSTKKHRNIFEFMKDRNVTSVLLEKEFGVDWSGKVDLENFQYYINIVKDIGDKKRLSKLLDHTRGCLNQDSSEVIGELLQRVHEIMDHRVRVAHSGDVVKRVMKNISDKVKNPDVVGIPLNDEQFPVLNRSVMGWIPNKLVYISGPTGHGKTTLACNFIDDLIFNKNEPVAMFSLEMSEEEIIEKQLAIRSGVSGTKLVTGSLEQSEYDEVVKIAKDFLSRNLYMISGVYDLYKIISMAKSLTVRKKVKVFVIDYIQLIATNSGKDRWEQLMDISKALKSQICSMGVTVLAVSQLSKASLKEDIAQAVHQSGSYGMLSDADVAMTVRQLPVAKIKDGVNMHIFVDKHRYGPDKVLIDAKFDKGLQKIQEVMG